MFSYEIYYGSAAITVWKGKEKGRALKWQIQESKSKIWYGNKWNGKNKYL
jgi:hypothetical protein